jgi:hypothetical protein
MIVVPVVALTFLLVRLLVNVRKTRPEWFVQSYLAAIAAKLVLSLGWLIALVARSPEKAATYTVWFLITYVLATTAEVAVLLKK